MRKTLFYIAVTTVICLASFLLGMSITDIKTVTSGPSVVLGTQDSEYSSGPGTAPPNIIKEYYTREDVNGEVKKLIQEGQLDRLLNIYSYLSRDPIVTEEIINHALRLEIPVNLLFALIQVESGFKTNLIARNQNGSADYGIMQCNSRTFPKYTSEELLDLRTNLKLGSEYLVKMKKAHTSWEMAVYRYNGIGSRAVRHMSKVISQERSIDRVINRYI